MKSVTYENQFNHERVVCDDTRLKEVIDGVEYVYVRRLNSPTKHLMRKDVLVKVSDKKSK